METPPERPRVQVLMALPSVMNYAVPRATCICDLMEVMKRQRAGWRVIAVDPDDLDAFHAWRAAHPEVGS